MPPQGPVHSALVCGIVARLIEIFPRDAFCVRPQSTLLVPRLVPIEVEWTERPAPLLF